MSGQLASDEFAGLAQLDYDPLSQRVSRAEVAAYRARARGAGVRFPNSVWLRIKSVVWLVVIALMVLVVLSIAALMMLLLLPHVSTAPLWLTLAVGLGTILAAAYCIYLMLRGLNRSIMLRSPWPRRLRMSLFARANGLAYLPISPGPAIPSTVFANDPRATATDRIMTKDGRHVEVGNVQRTIGDWVNTDKFAWGYLAVSLDRALPHIVLTTKVGRYRLRKRGIPASFVGNQVLRLEGNFDRYFTLHAPHGYERDALYIFAPDLMALMIDEAAALEVEIIDDWILFYSPVEFNLAKPDTLRRLFQIARLVGSKTLRQTSRYNDQATGGFEVNRVAAPGRRLRQGVSVLAATVSVVWVVLQIMRVVYVLN